MLKNTSATTVYLMCWSTCNIIKSCLAPCFSCNQKFTIHIPLFWRFTDERQSWYQQQIFLPLYFPMKGNEHPSANKDRFFCNAFQNIEVLLSQRYTDSYFWFNRERTCITEPYIPKLCSNYIKQQWNNFNFDWSAD